MKKHFIQADQLLRDYRNPSINETYLDMGVREERSNKNYTERCK
jgi:hypothetical protein